MGMSVLALPRPAEPVRRRALWLSRLVRRRATVVGLVLLAVTTLVGVLAPVIAGDPLRMEVSARLTAPGALHWFGTDDVGRDVWSRVVYGARLSLLVGAAVVLLASARQPGDARDGRPDGLPGHHPGHRADGLARPERHQRHRRDRGRLRAA